MIKLVCIFYTDESGNIVCGDLGFTGLDKQFRLLSFLIVDGKKNKEREVYAMLIHSDSLERANKSTSSLFCEISQLQVLERFLYVASIDTLFDLNRAPSRETSLSKNRGVTPFPLTKTVRLLQVLEPFIFDVFIKHPKGKDILNIKTDGVASGEQ